MRTEVESLALSVSTIPSHPVESQKRIRALVVDDMPQVIRLVSMILKRGDAEVVATAKDGIAAVHAATKLEPNLIVMDVNMPSMNGLDATLRIRERLPNTKIIIMSADADEILTDAALECGANACINKESLSQIWEQQLECMFPPLE